MLRRASVRDWPTAPLLPINSLFGDMLEYGELLQACQQKGWCVERWEAATTTRFVERSLVAASA